MNNFPMNNEALRNAMYEQGRRVSEFNKHLVDTQLSGLKQAEKAMVTGMETSLKMIEAGYDIQKATYQSWLDMMAPKAEQAKS